MTTINPIDVIYKNPSYILIKKNVAHPTQNGLEATLSRMINSLFLIKSTNRYVLIDDCGCMRNVPQNWAKKIHEESLNLQNQYQ